MDKVKTKFSISFHPVDFSKRVKKIVASSIEGVKYITSFSWLLTVYMCAQGVVICGRIPFIPHSIKQSLSPSLIAIYKKLIAPTRISEKTINRLNLIELAIKHMAYKKSRSFITIGGMSVGIAAIVFLVSVGFGLQDLVINRVARLDELRQADVTVQTGSNQKIDDKTIASISDIPAVEEVLPLIAVVGRVSLNESIFDVAVFGVTSEYLNKSATKPVRGRIFDSNDLTVQIDSGKVAGVESQREIGEYSSKIQDIDFIIDPDEWLPVRSHPTHKSALLGYTKREVGSQLGEEYWGSSYLSEDGAGNAGITVDQESLGRWIKSTFRLWDKEICLISQDPDCVNNQYVVQRENESSGSAQIQQVGYVVEKSMSIQETFVLDELGSEPSVLGETADATDSGELVEDTSDTGEIADVGSTVNEFFESLNLDASSAALLEDEGILASSAASIENIKQIKLDNRALKEAIVNRAMLSLLGLDEEQAVGETFSVSFVVTGALTENEERIKSQTEEYTIVGVDPESDTPFFYVPFIDVRTLGITNYSQLKVVSKSDEDLQLIRDQISVLGYATSSVVDTVERITSFFGTLRIVLALVGGVALAVASLGMFNTLTVSLLERTREVGLMKAMGMRSYEVQELFLTESMIMGFFGGLFGIILGIGSGKVIGIILSLFAVSQGSGLISVSSTPPVFVILTMLFSLFVGLITGIYPAQRAKKISALNALRYE